ncbi:phosphotransferase family protein [uncultured Corynebacterium sp.]|uniref:phosphotransferase family protein n=1 Tax=uncultured Corynebacterium sp. TaxID=159447 RepID=UPI0025E61593|nr:phosphotransferase [uncultured Corynebacterium sp.]
MDTSSPRIEAAASNHRAPDVEAAVRAAFPGLTWARTEFPEQGLDHHVAILVGPSDNRPAGVTEGLEGTEGSEGTARIVARLAVAPGVVGRADVEARILAAIAANAPAALPEALATDGDSLTLARHVPGVALTDAVWADLDDASRRRAAADVAATLDSAHRLDVADPAIAAAGNSWFSVKHGALTRGVDKHLCPVLDDRDRDGVRAIMEEAADVFLHRPVPPRLIHGDLHETHLRWDGAVGIIDFSDMTLADPAIDVAHLPGIAPELRDRVVSDLSCADDDLERRAAVYSRWDAVFLMVDHLTTGRTPETTARALLGRALESVRDRRRSGAGHRGDGTRN